MDNPSAFPVNDANLGQAGAYPAEPGMTLRDYFAGHALPLVKVEGPASPDQNLKAIANAAYKIADAMLAERTKEQSNG